MHWTQNKNKRLRLLLRLMLRLELMLGIRLVKKATLLMMMGRRLGSA